MQFLVYLRLIVLTAGTLLPFFWIVVILGHRRRRNFERIFFFLCLGLVFFFGSSLLALNSQLYYGAIPPPLATFAWVFLCLGLWFLPSLLVHVHAEYAQIRELLRPGKSKLLWLAGAYAPAVFLLPWLYRALRLRNESDFVLPSESLGKPFQAWLLIAVLVSIAWQRRFAKHAPDEQQQSFHRTLCRELCVVASFFVAAHILASFVGRWEEGPAFTSLSSSFLAFSALSPLIGLILNVQKFNFLQIGRQRNLIYAVCAVFLALLYLSFVRRVSLWLDPFVPPEATAAILLFFPVVLFEPLQRGIRGLLRRTAQSELDRAQRMMGPVLEVARLGNMEKLKGFIQEWLAEELQLSEVQLLLDRTDAAAVKRYVSEEVFVIGQPGRGLGVLRVRAHGAMVSGETTAALQFLCEQLPGALDLCRLIEEKLRLERELAERERLALLGQMAASISHNLKNPLGSIKTILQVQMENPELPDASRRETGIVLDEISRLSAKLNQLLQFSRPAVRGGGSAASCDPRSVVEEVAGVLRHEAERRGIALDVKAEDGPVKVAASPEALNDIVSNLMVNALEATPHGGHVLVRAAADDATCSFTIEDDGPGIPLAARDKILQPFFTTKARGTGLGLAIVARRVAEFSGRLEWRSPISDGHGTRFRVTLPVEATGNSENYEAMK